MTRASETAVSFHCLLSWLDEGADSAGQKYLEIRRRLVGYFERKRCAIADELADETLSRIARRLGEQGAIAGIEPARYCYVTAKFVFLEYVRSTGGSRRSLEPLDMPAPAASDNSREEVMLDNLDRCLQGLEAADRSLILEYYCEDRGAQIGRRRDLAARLRMTANALTIRACRIRARLERCVHARLSEESRA